MEPPEVSVGNGSQIKPLTCGHLESGAQQLADDKVLTVFHRGKSFLHQHLISISSQSSVHSSHSCSTLTMLTTTVLCFYYDYPTGREAWLIFAYF